MKKLTLLLPLLLLSSCNNAVRKSPLDWCLWEIHKHEDYAFEWSYIYNEIKNHDDSDNDNLDAYYITVFMDDRIGEWYCFIECEHKSFLDRMFDDGTYYAE